MCTLQRRRHAARTLEMSGVDLGQDAGGFGAGGFGDWGGFATAVMQVTFDGKLTHSTDGWTALISDMGDALYACCLSSHRFS